MITVVAHKHPAKFSPRGGEKSVKDIIDFLVGKGYSVRCVIKGRHKRKDIINGVVYKVFSSSDYEYQLRRHIANSSLVMTWATAAPLAAEICKEVGVPYLLMVRWWRLVRPLPPGDLMTKKIDLEFTKRHNHIFQNAAAIITNNNYSASIINRYYDVRAMVSYVPCPDKIIASGNKDGYIAVITPNKGLGERDLLKGLSELGKYKLLVVNSGEMGNGIKSIPYVKNMADVWGKIAILLYPVYNNDVCGTSRVAIEANSYGIPVVANNRSGICEKGIEPVPYHATLSDWEEKIDDIYQDYENYVDRSHENVKNYDTDKQLKVYSDTIYGIIPNELNP